MNRISVGLTALLLTLLAACGGGGTDQEEPTLATPRVDCEANPVQCH